MRGCNGLRAGAAGRPQSSLYTLSQQAAADLVRILDESEARWGESIAERTEARLKRQFERIGSGMAMGHQRTDVPEELPLLFVVEKPFVIAFDRASRTIVRVLHERSDVGRALRR
jgi:plasmid stabilization system protein ParE